MTLSWDEPEDASIESYQVLRRSRDGSEYGDGLGAVAFVVVADSTGSSATTYTDSSVTARTRYVYRVKSRNSGGLSAVSSYANAETTEAPPEALDVPEELEDSLETSPVQDVSSRPNVVLILADDLGWGDIGSNNTDSFMTTPRIDSIAATGARFTDAHSSSSLCSPTRYGLLTGRYSWRSWLTESALGGSDRPMIGSGQQTLGTLLQRHGYRTAAVGKWHLGMEFAHVPEIDDLALENRGIDFSSEILDGPLDHGFDEFFGTSANLRWPPGVFIRDDRFLANPNTQTPPGPGFVEFDQALDLLTDEAVSFVERAASADEPFFLYLPLTAPHVPLAPNALFAGSTGLGDYADFVAQLDWTVGEVLDALDEAGVRDDTLVVFTSDNGSYMRNGIPMPNHETHLSNGAWRDAKGSIYEGGHRVPLLLQWPLAIEAGSTIDATVSLTDVYATLADIVGEESEAGVAVDSLSLLPLLRGEAASRGVPVVHHSANGTFALRDGRWKLVFSAGTGAGYNHGGEAFSRPWQLYDLEQAPEESANLAASHRDVVQRLEAALYDIRLVEDGTLSGDAALRALHVAGADIGPFSPDRYAYSATVDSDVSTVVVAATPRATDANVETTIPGLLGPRGRLSATLAPGRTTTVTVQVTSPNNSETETYRVDITRPPTAEMLAPLTAEFQSVPDGHDGSKTIVFRVLFSEPITAGFRSLRDHVIEVANGVIKRARRVEGRGDLREIHVQPSSDAAVVVVLPATADCGAPGAVCTRDGKPLSSRLELTVAGPAPPDTVWESELTAAEAADYVPTLTGYSFYGASLGTLSPNRLEIDGATYTVMFLMHINSSLRLGVNAALPTDFTVRVGGSTYRGSESMIPSGGASGMYWWPSPHADWPSGDPVPVSLTVHSGVPMTDRQPAPVTGHFRGFPLEHDGNKDISFRIYFSEEVTATADDLRNHVLAVSGGTMSSVERVGSSGRIWAVSVTPDSTDRVTIQVQADMDCDLAGAICSADGRRLFNPMELTVPAEASITKESTPRPGGGPADRVPRDLRR